MSDRDGGRMAADDALGRQIKANLRGLDSFIPPAPSFATIDSPALKPLASDGKPAVRARLNPKATTGFLAAGLIVAVVLGSAVWRPSHSAGAVDSPDASGVSSTASVLDVPSFDAPSAATSAGATNGVSEASLVASSGTIMEPTVAPTTTPEPSTSAGASLGGTEAPVGAPWYASELYLLSLINCTRTGGWVTAKGTCSSDSHHTLPAQAPLVLDLGISADVARPYAKYMADRRVLSYYLGDTTPHSRLCSAGYCGATWGENIASPYTPDRDGMITVQVFYQNEYWCQCEHYANVMNPLFHRVGIGVWETSGTVRIVVDFYV
ncbi:MAG TPA: CAP domain-containing protein [Candidatus Limnocylindrales bacterium]